MYVAVLNLPTPTTSYKHLVVCKLVYMYVWIITLCIVDKLIMYMISGASIIDNKISIHKSICQKH